MRRSKLLLSVMILALCAAAAAAQRRNSIGGHVFNEERRPLQNIRVELLDEVDSMLATTLTDGTGRYQFSNLSHGTFQVRVLTHGTDYDSQTARVTITNFATGSASPGTTTLSGAQYEQVMFTLKRRKGAPVPGAGPGTTFAQNVPDAARQVFEKAIESLNANANSEEGLNGLKQALDIFPDYFLALERLGLEYVKRGQYAPAVEVLNKAIQINPKGHLSHYGLGYAQFYLKRLPDAIDALKRSVTLAPNAFASQYILGYALFRDKEMEEAELHLKKAKELDAKQFPLDGHMALAQVYSNSKRYKEAADELEQYLVKVPDAPNAGQLKGIVKTLREKAQP